MLSIERQCTEVCQLLEQLQACVDRRGWVITARQVDFAVYVARARQTMGVLGGVSPDTAARDFYKAGRP